jgi:membrane protease YdiL (CAAX protease family)
MLTKNLIPIFYFVLCVILGLLLSNLLLIGILFIQGGNLEELLSDSNSLMNSLSSHELLISQMCSQVFSLILPAYLYSKMNSDAPIKLNRNAFNPELLILAIILFATSIPLVALSAYLNQFIPLSDWMTSTESQMNALIEKMLNLQAFTDLLIAIIVIAVIPAIGEEWVFRGIVQNQLVRWIKNPWTALIISAFFFSAIHMQFQGFLPRFFLGLILGYIYLITGNLWYSILLHFLNNGFQVLGVYFYKEEMLKQIQNDIELPSTLSIVGSCIMFPSIIYFINKRMKHLQHA